MIRLGVVGCGDVAFRTYLPGLAPLAGRAEVAACFDPRSDRAERAAGMFPGAAVYTEFKALLAHPDLDAILNFTPAPFHRDVNAAALEAGLHVYSEKPLAATVAEGQDLIALAKRRERFLLSAPAVMATARFRWLRELIAAGRIGRPTLAVGQMANMGPASWRQYTGDPAVFYGADVGPLLDTGVYVLHAITGLLGPARRVQAFGGIAIPRRDVLIPGREGEVIEVGANDHMLLHLDFGDNAFAQVLSSFATPRSQAPAFEIHGTDGSIAISLDQWYDANGPVDLFHRDGGPLALEGWLRNVSPPTASPFGNLIANGPPQLVACIEGTEQPIITAEHAVHVLDIILAATRSATDGGVIDLATTF